MLALASVLSLLRPPKAVVRYAITAAELLTRSAGAFACEAALGWLDAPELSEEVVQAAQATAASLGAKMAQRRATPRTAPQIKSERTTSTDAGRGRQSEQHQNGDAAPEQMDTNVNMEDADIPAQKHRQHSKDAEQVDEDPRDPGSDQDQPEQPLVQYADDEQDQDEVQYDDDYDASAQQEYDMEGNEDQEQDQQYDGSGQHHPYPEDNDQYEQEDYPEQQQHERVVLEGSERQLESNGEGGAHATSKATKDSQDEVSQNNPSSLPPADDADEWDVSETGDTPWLHMSQIMHSFATALARISDAVTPDSCRSLHAEPFCSYWHACLLVC